MKKGCILFLLLNLIVISIIFAEKGYINLKLDMMGKTIQTVVEKPKVALTFDDGPHPYFTEKLLDGLKKRNVKVTFFMMGKSVEGHEDIVKRVAEEGHLIGNHSYSHIQLNAVSEETVCAELSKTYNLIYEATGQETMFVRSPFGEWKDSYDDCVDMIPVFWTIDTVDWNTKDVSTIVNRVVNKVEENDIILMHDCYDTSVEAALQIIDYLQDKGYDIVTVDEIVLE